MTEPLSMRQKRFVVEYLKDFNGTQAAIRAGYSSKGAHVAAIRLLRNATILALVEDYKKKADITLGLNQQWVLKRAMLLADGNVKRLATWNQSGVTCKTEEQLSEEDAFPISELIQEMDESGGTTRIKLKDGRAALEMLAKFTGVLELHGGRYAGVTNAEPSSTSSPSQPMEMTPQMELLLPDGSKAGDLGSLLREYLDPVKK